MSTIEAMPESGATYVGAVGGAGFRFAARAPGASAPAKASTSRTPVRRRDSRIPPPLVDDRARYIVLDAAVCDLAAYASDSDANA